MGPLEGIKVIDLSQWGAGPASATILGDWGAEVIHVEDPEGGDPLRGMQSVGTTQVGDVNSIFENLNRNKRSLAVDITLRQGKKIIYELVKNSDVFISNLRNKVLNRIGLDYGTLGQINPRIIYAHITGYGEKGPETERGGYDYAAYWARTGLMNSSGEAGTPPAQQGGGWGDLVTGFFLAGSISAALFVRERTGIGQEVDISLMGAGMWMGAGHIQIALDSGIDYPQISRKKAGNPLVNSYQARDNRWLLLICMQTDRYWSGFCKAIDRPDLEHDPRFNSHGKRCQNNMVLIDIIDSVLSTRSVKEWGEKFDRNGVLWGPVQNYLEVINDEQALQNDLLVAVNHPKRGAIKLVNSPIKFSKTPSSIRSAAPELGQHTEEVLLENGYTWEDIERLKQEKVIG